MKSVTSLSGGKSSAYMAIHGLNRPKPLIEVLHEAGLLGDDAPVILGVNDTEKLSK